MSEYLAKSKRALASSRLLLIDGDTEGASDRAYYAMFNAAHAALLSRQTSLDLVRIRTHSGLINAVGQELVKPGVLSPELGKARANASLAANIPGA